MDEGPHNERTSFWEQSHLQNFLKFLSEPSLNITRATVSVPLKKNLLLEWANSTPWKSFSIHKNWGKLGMFYKPLWASRTSSVGRKYFHVGELDKIQGGNVVSLLFPQWEFLPPNLDLGKSLLKISHHQPPLIPVVPPQNPPHRLPFPTLYHRSCLTSPVLHRDP